MHLPSPFCPGYTTPAPSLCTSPHPACMPSPSAHMLGGAGGIACPPPVPSTWAMPTPSPSLCTPTCPARMPSPFAIGGTVPQPVPSAMLCKPCPLVYAPTPHAHPSTVPSTWTTPMPPPQFTHPALPCMHALPLCHRRDSAPASLLCHAMQTLPPGLCPHPTHMSTHSPLYLDYSNATPPVYTPHPTCMPSPFAHMPGVQEDRWNTCKGEGHAQGERAHGMRDGATHTITMVPPHACKGHASKVGHHPGGGAACKQKGGHTKAGVQKGDSVPPCACKGEGVRVGWWAHQSRGAKRSWQQVTVCPHMHAKGEGV